MHSDDHPPNSFFVFEIKRGVANMQRGRAAVKVSTKLTLGLGADTWDTQKAEGSRAARNGCKQQSKPLEDEMSMGPKDWRRKCNIKELMKQQMALREKEQYEQLMEKEHFQLQETIKYYKDAGQEQSQMHEQLLMHMHALDYAQVELHLLRQEIVLLRAETARLNEAIVQQSRDREPGRLHLQLVHQHSMSFEHRSHMASATSEPTEANDAVGESSSKPVDGTGDRPLRQASPGTTAAAAGRCPFCPYRRQSSRCPYCVQPGLGAAEVQNSPETDVC
ncbi:hypothetical protein MPTK1_4g05640 [Marchantia polymorpha subsp. ruderalis]|uniref:Uncharacterized protein n=2 Tax=Marchantia polymorpha TaxID=3197 RepID=A0AAF6B6Q3_MARPO|nr:hypothetical protein MARPO_0087s0027 [Marchantia polymorpha]BBN07687.1 hypothetical protein Mp_4g05640 [Marchantia polymorpha subsp. ruderalis]|eukprot:PTQ33586.1 hypothetical protein MARPO_0087s0027 [Marchantia polymorpha]